MTATNMISHIYWATWCDRNVDTTDKSGLENRSTAAGILLPHGLRAGVFMRSTAAVYMSWPELEVTAFSCQWLKVNESEIVLCKALKSDSKPVLKTVILANKKKTSEFCKPTKLEHTVKTTLHDNKPLQLVPKYPRNSKLFKRFKKVSKLLGTATLNQLLLFRYATLTIHSYAICPVAAVCFPASEK